MDYGLHFSNYRVNPVRCCLIALALCVVACTLSGITATRASAEIDDFPDGQVLREFPATLTGSGGIYGVESESLVRLEISPLPPEIYRFNEAAEAGTEVAFLSDKFEFNFSNVRRYDFDIYPAPRIEDGKALPEGRYILQVTQDGDLGAPFPKSYHFKRRFYIDHTRPDTVISSATPASPTTSGVRSFTWDGIDPPPGNPYPLKFECRLNGSPWVPCGIPYNEYTTPVLGEGERFFEVRAIDATGLEDLTPAVSSWIIDRTKPTITLDKPAMRERFTLDEHVPTGFSCDDPLAGFPPAKSGIKTCSGPATVDTSQLGNFTYTVEAEDNAGNTHSVTHSYAVDPPKYADVINSNHPIAYYRLGDPLGSDQMADSSGNNRNGEYKNGISLRQPPAVACQVRPHAPYTCDLNADPQDWAANFPARDGYGFTKDVPAPQTAYTIEGWIKRFDDNDGSIFGQGGGGQLLVHDGKLALRQTQDTVYSEGPVLTPNVWWHVAATWDGHNTRLYVNGNLVGFSNSANKAPTGTSTIYTGYGDQAPWWHGSLDEIAYYGSVLSQGAIKKRYVVGTAKDVPSPAPDGPPIQRPAPNMTQPNNGGLYAHGKVPPLDFYCEDLDGNATVASCTATVDGNPIANGAALPDTPGPHTVVVTAIDNTELMRSHSHTYTVKPFEDIYNTDSPIAYYRLGDATDGPMKDSGPNGKHGIYKNAQESGPVGISGDGDHARKFFGSSGYGYANNITAPTFQSTLEVWVNPDGQREQSIVGHGDAGEIYIGTDGTLNFKRMGVTVTTSPLVPGRFTQVVGVWDGTYIYLYVDGVLKAKAESTKRPSSSSTFYVGYGELRPWFKGSLDEVAYYGKALTANRILEHFLADPPPGDDTPIFTDPGTGDPGTNPTTPATPPDPGTDVPPAPGGSDVAVDSGVAKSVGKSKPRGLAKCNKIKNKTKRRKCKNKYMAYSH